MVCINQSLIWKFSMYRQCIKHNIENPLVCVDNIIVILSHVNSDLNGV